MRTLLTEVEDKEMTWVQIPLAEVAIFFFLPAPSLSSLSFEHALVRLSKTWHRQPRAASVLAHPPTHPPHFTLREYRDQAVSF